MTPKLQIVLIIVVAVVFLAVYYIINKAKSDKSTQSSQLLLQAMKLQQEREQTAADKKVTVKDITGAITGAGNIASLFVGSDMNIKNNISAIENPADRMSGLNAYLFKYNDSLENSQFDRQRVGFMAQQVEQSFPEAIFEVDGVKYVDYSQIVPLLVEVVKKQQIQINNMAVVKVKNSVPSLFKL